MKVRTLFWLVALVALAGRVSGAQDDPPAISTALQQADRLFKDQHWAEAAARYESVRTRLADWHAPAMRRAVEGEAACAAKLTFWDDALDRLETYATHNRDTLDEVAGQRLLASLYLSMPHNGVVQGGRFVRGASGQGVDKEMADSDQREAITRLEHARDVAARLAATLPPGAPESVRQEITQARIGTDFDLTTALIQTDANENRNQSLDKWLGVRSPPDGNAPTDRDATRTAPDSSSFNTNEPPAGIPPRSDGNPTFAGLPAAYGAGLTPAEKFLFLLTEVERLDTSPRRDDGANALFRRAMLAQRFYGPGVAEAWVQWWQNNRSPRVWHHDYRAAKDIPAPVPATKIWQLRDDQALVPVGGWLKVLDLPAGESPLALLAAVETRCPRSTLLPEVRYARALYLQDRQQFPRALADHRAIAASSPTGPRAKDARAQILEIEKPGVALGETQMYFPGERPRLEFSVRNAGTVRFTVTRFDLIRYKEATGTEFDEINLRNDEPRSKPETWRKYLQKEPVRWSETIPPGQENRRVEGSTLAPLAAPGAYVVEAQVDGNKTPARVLVVLTDILLLCKDAREGDRSSNLFVACDARTGRPLPDRALRVYESWQEPGKGARKPSTPTERQTLVTDANGAVFYRRKHPGQSSKIEAAMVGNDGRIAFSGLREARDNRADDSRGPDESKVGFLITDRPVYRPGATVHYCIWLRDLRGGVYRLPPPGPVQVSIRDPKSRQVQNATVLIDETGTVSGEYAIDAKASLGEYYVFVGKDVPAGALAEDWQTRYNTFRVEEYRQPEFEVNVRPAATQARLGEKFKATVEARYYFGAPVTQARVMYKVYREVFERSYYEPGEFDALYGKGYGLERYPYPWLPWWGRWGGQIGSGAGRLDSVPSPDWSGAIYDPRQLVAQGEAKLDADGKCEVEVDTARAKAEHGDHDHQYTVEATVIGSNRRAVEGTGGVVATRQAFYAFVETNQGWYTAGEEARLRVRTLTPDNVPIAVRGEVVLSRVHYDGPDGAPVREEEVRRIDGATDAEGRLSVKLALPDEGQYHVAFRARDAWNEEVQGNAVVWVQGPKFDGRVYRSNALEIITDQRSYRVGETAHLLINAAGDNSRVIFADHGTDGGISHVRFVDLPRRSAVIDVPIDESRVPNFAVEAIVVRDGRVRVEMCELVVPPEEKLLHLTLRTDKEVYQPGDTGTVHVEATDHAGNPILGQVTLTAFDKAVTYIQAETAVEPGNLFYGRRNFYQAAVDSSFDQGFEALAATGEPATYLARGDTPEGWDGSWKMGAGMKGTPLLRLLRDGFRGSIAERIVIVGSNIPSSEEVAVPTQLGDPSASSMLAARGGAADRPFGRSPALDSSAKAAEPTIRTNFSDTALWLPTLKLDANGQADTAIVFPQSLTTWRLHGYAINAATQVGDATAQAATTRKLLVRLLSPRFFTERDETILSAAVNNAMADAQEVTAELLVPAALFQPVDGSTPKPDADGNLRLTATANVAPGGEHRFDWRVKVLHPGTATITARALTPQESDGVRLTFPVVVHGIAKSLVQGGSFRVGQEGDRALRFDVPAEIDPGQTRLEINLSAGLAGVLIDALPYLADYPYGCVEQTMSRFYPSVLVRDTLKRMGTDLETIGNQRRQMNPADLASRFGNSPVYDSARLDRMIREGLTVLYDAQDPDGGWGWWGGEEPSLFQTAYVLQGLHAARAAGVHLDENSYSRGFVYLWRTVSAELARPLRKQALGNLEQQVYCAYILSLEPLPELEPTGTDLPAHDEGTRNKWLDRLYAGRGGLNNQCRALLALALHHAGRDAQARTVLRNLLQFVERDDASETAHVRTPAEGWWFWWNSDIETNAWALKALVALDPKSDLAPRMVKWLLENRRNGASWRSTRDTAQVISAMTDYLLASGEATPDYHLTVSVDGETVRDVQVTRENRFAFDNRVVLTGAKFGPGTHAVTVHKVGAGALYYACQLTYFTHEEGVAGAGNGIGIERRYFKLVPKPAGAQPEPAEEADREGTPAGYTAVLLKDGDELASGELLEVVLRITAKNTYDYLAFEDPKPAGCEPVEVRSGGKWQDGFCANVELRDTKTVFFVEWLEQGEHLLRYRLRAETPGKFHVLPATGGAMYAPELRANSDEMRLDVRD